MSPGGISFCVEGWGEGGAVGPTAARLAPRGAMPPTNTRSVSAPAHLKNVSTVMAPPMTLPGRVSRMPMSEGFISGALGSGRGGERCVMLKLWMKICVGRIVGKGTWGAVHARYWGGCWMS